jgi:hypothetical protein
MTAAEEASVDFPSRIAFMDMLHERLIPALSKLDDVGGIYVDQTNGMNAVVQLTRDDTASQEVLAALAPEGGRVTFEIVRSTANELDAALLKAKETWYSFDVQPRSYFGGSVDTAPQSTSAQTLGAVTKPRPSASSMGP